MKRVMIYGYTMYSAERCFTQVTQLAGVRPEQISQARKSKSEISITMQNGDFYQAIVPSQNSRGIKASYAFIDLAIDSELIYDVLIPTVINSDNVFFFR